MKRTVRLVLLREIPEDANLRQQWNAVARSMEQSQVFFTYEWAVAVQRAYQESLHPMIFLAYDQQDSLYGVAALATDNSGASFLCATTGDYCDFLSAPEDRTAFVTAVLAELSTQGIDRVTLTNLPGDSATPTALRQAAATNGYFRFARTAYDCAQVALSLLERRAGETKPRLPQKKKLRRALNALGHDAPVQLDHARSWNDVEPILPVFIQAHVARFLVTGRISNLARRERRIFLEELAKLLCQSGWLTLTRLASGSRTYAWNYGFEFEGTWFWYQPTFDSDVEKYSPGFCLLARIIEDAAGSPLMKTVDFGLGAEDYKASFGNQTRETLYVTLRRSFALHAGEVIRYRAARAVMAVPRLESIVRATAARLQRLRDSVRIAGLSGTFGSMAKRIGGILWSREEVYFFDWPGADIEQSGMRLEPLDLNRLASAVPDYVDDSSTCAYLLRSADRLRTGGAESFGLIDDQGKIVHFAWVTSFDGFYLSELNTKVDAPSPDSVLLFDCWTPEAERGRGYYGQAVRLVAKRMEQQGKKPWIFSAARNTASVHGLEKAGFQRRYSLFRRRAFGWQTISGQTPRLTKDVGAEVSARV